ncbi:hypothetical protein NLG97_g4753 [Lecanicillium saksenae]|uniref:Uncharacterized protein n=1 Tax=Lecanicillium saksenae TaxID=468837 RepID=A0ACC1QWZ7_9HYPO|nr:hypothetical protein NLG97_g4753 [Lecanicillium saksenae]
MAAARAMLDETHDELPVQVNDSNSYTLGRIKEHNIVIACLPIAQYGTNNAANVLTNLIRTFSSIRLALMVGVGGGVPTRVDVRLGDVIVGTRVLQHDLGKLTGDTHIRTTAVPRVLHPSVGTAVLNLRSKHELEPCRIPNIFRERLQQYSEYSRPSLPDRLFQPSYPHKSPGLGCEECDLSQLLPRSIRTSDDPIIHYGTIASGNQVLRHSSARDELAQKLDIICFEMEAAGLMDFMPCLPIRGVCDYSDSHKTKEWQAYAAATAAAYAREFLDFLPAAEVVQNVSRKRQGCHFMVPFGRNKDFIGRESIITQLLAMILPSADQEDCQRVVVEGLGGVGKTQIALEAIFRLRRTHPDCSVFWVPAVDNTSIEISYREIGQRLKVPGIEEDNADVGLLVKAALSETASNWLLVLDNVDDTQLLSGTLNSVPLHYYLPFSYKGSILIITRNHQVAIGLDVSPQNTFRVGEMDRDEALQMLRQTIGESSQAYDDSNANTLLDLLADLPLAVKQAASYIAKTGTSVGRYTKHCQSSDRTLIKLLSKGFEDRNRYKTLNPVAVTWLISFEEIIRERYAGQYLVSMCFFAEKDIPNDLLPRVNMDDIDEEIERDEALGLLKAYSFISEHRQSNSFNMHRLVRLALRNWLEVEHKLRQYSNITIQWLATVFPSPSYTNRDIWLKYLPHTRSALTFSETIDKNDATGGLLFKMGTCFRLLGKYKDAERFYYESVQLRSAVMGMEHPTSLDSLNSLANVLQHQGRDWEAERTHRRTWELRRKALGPEHPDTISSMNNLALSLVREARPREAERLLRQALDFRAAVLGEEHGDTLATMSNLALVLESNGSYEEALDIYQQTAELMEKTHGKEHSSTLICRNNLGNVLQRLGRHSQSEETHRQTLQLRQKVLGDEHPDTFASMSNLALLLVHLERFDEGQKLHEETLKRRQMVLGKEHPDTLAIVIGESASLEDGGAAFATFATAIAPPVMPPMFQSATDEKSSRATCHPLSVPTHSEPVPPRSSTLKSSSSAGKRRALLVGINYTGQPGELHGCIDDVRNMTAYLIDDLGCKREDMVILTDDQQNRMSQPTKQNILRSMRWLVRDAEPHDSLFFHYSGRGGQNKDDELDGLNEVIYPIDFQQHGHITDDEMHEIMVKPLCAKVRLTVIFDSCHFSAPLDLPYTYSTQGILKEPNLAKEAGQCLLGLIALDSDGDISSTSLVKRLRNLFRRPTARDKADDPAVPAKTSPANVFMFSASGDQRTSATLLNSLATCTMSSAFITALKKKPDQNYAQLLVSIRDQFEPRYTQRPQVSCSHPLDANQLFTL